MNGIVSTIHSRPIGMVFDMLNTTLPGQSVRKVDVPGYTLRHGGLPYDRDGVYTES